MIHIALDAAADSTWLVKYVWDQKALMHRHVANELGALPRGNHSGRLA